MSHVDSAESRTSPESQVSTPSLRRTLRRSAYWIAALAFALIVALVTIGVTGASSAGDPLSASNPAPAGAQALVEVLRDRGVQVTATDSLVATRAAATSPTDTTIVLYDPDSLLNTDQLGELAQLTGNLILVQPSFTVLNTLVPAVAVAGEVAGPLTADNAPDCAVRAVERAGTVVGDALSYRLVDDAADASLCLRSDTESDDSNDSATGDTDTTYSLIRVESDSGTRTVLGTADALSNEGISAGGNAALALGLMGQTASLIWYLPSLADLATATPPSLADLSPGWLVPVAILALLVALAAAFWRGRRLGPLVVERLPVVVRASETMEGRARLYERSSARLRALDALRIGGIDRICRMAGLPQSADVTAVIAAAAELTGRDPASVSALLLTQLPRTDSDLVRMSDELLELERAVAVATRPD